MNVDMTSFDGSEYEEAKNYKNNTNIESNIYETDISTTLILPIMTDEQRLLSKILNGYDTASRPIFNASKSVQVGFQFTLIQISQLIVKFLSSYYNKDGSWSSYAPLIWNQGFPNPLGVSFISINSVKVPEIRFSFSQFRKQHPWCEIAGKHGIQQTARMQLNDLEFADDLTLLSHTQQQMQDKTTIAAAASAAVGLNIHKDKSKILRYNTTCNN
ncbi:unnamed protein product [Schistosoma margrebowiei]|uniref:Uncharacterized protein n=1 Tax=Schistosoma margrebowiei TaxID=48269 RepID=A0A183LE02_9TREM|nr:unnamed protein product [Schistosoma margrebowiei]